MTLVIPAGAAHVVQELTHASDSRKSLVSYGVDTDLVVDATAVANTLQTAFHTHLKVNMDSNVSIGVCTVSIGSGTPGEPIVGDSTNAAVVGSRSGTVLPSSNALMVTKRTARGGKRGRGRMFFPWTLQTSEVTEVGIVSSVILTAWQSALNAWLAALSSASLPMVLLHSEGESSPGAPDPVISLSPDSLLSTQRRRLGR